MNDQSIIFSPPSILKETIHEEHVSLNDAFSMPDSPNIKKVCD